MVLCNKIFLKKQDPSELGNLQSQCDRPQTGDWTEEQTRTRDDTICISLLQQSRHNSTVSQQINTVHATLETQNALRQETEPKNKIFKSCNFE